MEHLTTPSKKFYIPPHPFCIYGRVAYFPLKPLLV